MFSQRWNDLLAKHRAMVPAGSPFSAYKQAVKDASAEYHGLTRSNPDLSRGIKLIGGAALAYVLYRAVKSGQLSTAGIQRAMSGNTGL